MHVMTQLFHPFIDKFVIVCVTKSREEHLNHFGQFLRVLRCEHFYINLKRAPSRVPFCLVFLRYIVSSRSEA